MSVSYFVFYQGEAADNADFMDHYRNVHLPLLQKFPGILGVRLHQPAGVTDAEAVNPGGFLLICEMRFGDETQLAQALASDARKAAREDFRKFPEFRGHIWHQAMHTENI